MTVRRHPAVLLKPFLVFLGVLLFVGWVSARLPPGSPLVDLLWYAALAVLAYVVWQVAQWAADRLYITDRRILLASGLLTRRVAMMPLSKVTDMSYQRSVLGRLFGYGEFVLESAGQEQALRNIRYLPSPDLLYLEVCDLMFGRRDGRK